MRENENNFVYLKLFPFACRSCGCFFCPAACLGNATNSFSYPATSLPGPAQFCLSCSPDDTFLTLFYQRTGGSGSGNNITKFMQLTKCFCFCIFIALNVCRKTQRQLMWGWSDCCFRVLFPQVPQGAD